MRGEELGVRECGYEGSWFTGQWSRVNDQGSGMLEGCGLKLRGENKRCRLEG